MLLCGGLIVLTSCNDNIYQEIDEMNAPPTFNNEQSGHAHGDAGGSGLIWVGDNYASPWDIWFRENDYGPIGNLQPSYMMSNGDMESITSYYNLEVFAYIGLAYFDGDDNGIFHDVAHLDPITGLPIEIADMVNNPTLFPNLYPPGNQHEVGNLVKTVVPIHSNAYPDPLHGFRIEDRDKHLLMPGGNNKFLPMYPNWWQVFDFAGTILPDEVELLRTYGKVFFYEVNVYDKNTGAPVLLGQIMHPEIETLTVNYNPEWNPIMSGGVQVQGDAPTLGPRDLYYYYAGLPNGTQWDPMYDNNDLCDSREVVFYIPENLHTIPIPGGLNTLRLYIAQSSMHLWLNSALALRVE